MGKNRLLRRLQREEIIQPDRHLARLFQVHHKVSEEIDTNLVFQIPQVNMKGEKSAPNYHESINRAAGVELCFS